MKAALHDQGRAHGDDTAGSSTASALVDQEQAIPVQQLNAFPIQTDIRGSLSSLSVEEITTEEQFAALEAEWNALVSRSQMDSLFLRHEWFSAWWKVYGRSRRLYILLARQGAELVGIAPLMRCRRRLRWFPLLSFRQIQFIENGAAMHADFIIRRDRSDALEALLQHLAAKRPGWTLVYLRKVRESSPLLAIDPRRLAGITMQTKEAMRSPVLKVSGTWQAFYESRSKTCRKRIRLTANRMQALGQLTVTKAADLPAWQAAMPLIWQVGANSPRRRQPWSVGRSAATRAFLSQLSTIAAQRGWLNAWLLSVDDKPIAFEYHLRYANEVFALRAEYDRRYEKYSPGFVLDCRVVEHCFDQGIERYHMGGSDNSYKLRWTSDVEPHMAVFLYSGNLMSRALRAAEFRLLPTLARLSALRSLREQAGRLVTRLKTAYADHGPLGILPAALARLGRSLYETNSACWFRRDLRRPIAEVHPAIPLSFQHNNPHATIKWMRTLQKPSIVDPAELAVAEAEDHYLVNVRHSGRIIGYVKVGSGRVYIQDYQRVVVFRPNEAFIYDTFVLPEFRRRGVALAAIEYCMRLLQQNGFTRLYCHIPTWNTASIGAYTRSGFQQVRSIRYRRIMGMGLLPETDLFTVEKSR